MIHDEIQANTSLAEIAKRDKKIVKNFKNDPAKKKFSKYIPQLKLTIYDDNEDRLKSLYERLTGELIDFNRKFDAVDDLVQELIELYKTKSLNEISEIKNLPLATVYRKLKKANVKFREVGSYQRK